MYIENWHENWNNNDWCVVVPLCYCCCCCRRANVSDDDVDGRKGMEMK